MKKVWAEAALAKGMAAQKQGTQVAALSYFYQAAALDPSLADAVNRSKIISANITSGNIGADVRNDIAWRREWVAKLTEFEEFFNNILNTADPPYTFSYSTDIQRGKINYQTETINLSIAANLRANIAWMNSVAQAANSVYKELSAGLNATTRSGEWGLSNWPRQGVTNQSPFASHIQKWYDISIAFELLNDQKKVIGKQTLRMTPNFSLYDKDGSIASRFTENTAHTVAFNAVNANDISDRMTIRIASVNGTGPGNAKIQITAISGSSASSGQSASSNANLLYDSREDKMYKTVKIGNRVWMAENLNYRTGNSWCYNNEASACDKLGRLYDWNTAKNACPSGWRLPTKQECIDLFNAVGGNKIAGGKLKSDEYGFSALPGGYYSNESNGFSYKGVEGYWWTATENEFNARIHTMYLWSDKKARIIAREKGYGLSVRCVQD
jgi:uncharacterized protein (TIGR02145 family)